MHHTRHHIAGEIVGFENTFAKIKLSDGQTLLLPIKNLPDNIALNTPVTLNCATLESSRQETDLLARELLNRILKKNTARRSNAPH